MIHNKLKLVVSQIKCEGMFSSNGIHTYFRVAIIERAINHYKLKEDICISNPDYNNLQVDQKLIDINIK